MRVRMRVSIKEVEHIEPVEGTLPQEMLVEGQGE